MKKEKLITYAGNVAIFLFGQNTFLRFKFSSNMKGACLLLSCFLGGSFVVVLFLLFSFPNLTLGGTCN